MHDMVYRYTGNGYINIYIVAQYIDYYTATSITTCTAVVVAAAATTTVLLLLLLLLLLPDELLLFLLKHGLRTAHGPIAV